MRVVVFDVAAESGGGLSVLDDFYSEMLANKENDYLLILSVINLKEADNIHIRNYRWIKNSWLHRLFFDFFIAPSLVRGYKAEVVISLQNIMICCKASEKVLLFQNILPLSDFRYGIKDFKLWIYQNIIGKMMIHSIKKSDKVIVQANWIRNQCVKSLKVPESKFIVRKAEYREDSSTNYKPSSPLVFFYPASAMPYKNHKVILEACMRIKNGSSSVYSFCVIFTLSGQENKNSRRIKETVEACGLPIRFVGELTRQEVKRYYGMSVLLFPSYIETVGLPLAEAAACNTPIIAADCMYAHETLANYPNVRYFKYNDAAALASEMCAFYNPASSDNEPEKVCQKEL
jgi:glycosyltransferase involved in cell wall biosynthesis